MIETKTLEKLKTMTDQQRRAWLYGLSRYFCIECGRWYDRQLTGNDKICQCWNDE